MKKFIIAGLVLAAGVFFAWWFVIRASDYADAHNFRASEPMSINPALDGDVNLVFDEMDSETIMGIIVNNTEYPLMVSGNLIEWFDSGSWWIIPYHITWLSELYPIHPSGTRGHGHTIGHLQPGRYRLRTSVFREDDSLMPHDITMEFFVHI